MNSDLSGFNTFYEINCGNRQFNVPNYLELLDKKVKPSKNKKQKKLKNKLAKKHRKEK